MSVSTSKRDRLIHASQAIAAPEKVKRPGDQDWTESGVSLIDLHVHTDCSDGTTSPADLMRQASALGIEALGITDHDTLAGYDAACTEAGATSGLSQVNRYCGRDRPPLSNGALAGLGQSEPVPTCLGPAQQMLTNSLRQATSVELICAVELSTRPAQQRAGSKREPSVHLLGYFLLSPPTLEFRDWLDSHQTSRRQRNIRLIESLHRLGVQVTLREAEVYGRNQVGRPHFAKVLCDKGYVSTLQEAFDVYLADDARAAVEREEPSLEESIQRIQDAGGLASLAHPARLPQRGRELAEAIGKLAAAGLQGIEVYHSEHRPEDSAAYMEIARRFDLIPTGGSDFHGANKPSVQLGTGIDGNICLPYSFLEQMRERCYAKQ